MQVFSLRKFRAFGKYCWEFTHFIFPHLWKVFCIYRLHIYTQIVDLVQGSATPGTRANGGTVTSGTLGISVQNISIVFSDPERDRRQSASPPAEGSHALNAAQKDKAPLSLTPVDYRLSKRLPTPDLVTQTIKKLYLHIFLFMILILNTDKNRCVLWKKW